MKAVLLTVFLFAATLRIGEVAPDFALLDINGKQHHLADFKGKIVVLNFWAFWCDTWEDELPHLKELAKQQDKLDFRLVTISVDGTRLQEFLKRTRGDVPFPVLLDVGGKVSAAYQVAHVPTVIIVDGEGRVRFVKSGYPGNHVILGEVRKVAKKLRSLSHTANCIAEQGNTATFVPAP